MAESLKEKTAKGLFWGALNNGTTQVLNAVIGIILGRLLVPEAWAPIATIAIFSAIAGNLQSSGFSTAIVNMKSPKDNDYNAVFWFNILTSFLVYILLFACSPLIAAYFEQPCLKDLSRFIFLSFFISSFGISTNAYMTKNMMNKEITIVSLCALVISGSVAIILALADFSYWSLAWQQVVNSTVLVVGRLFFVKWRPSSHVNFSPIRKTFRFSMNILVTMIINTINNNILNSIFGKLFTKTPEVVGNFYQAFKWDMMAYQTVGGSIDQVAQPVLVSLREEKGREVRAFRKMIRLTAFLSFPAMFGLSLVSQEFILATVGKNWIDSVPILRILCLGGAFMPFYNLYKNLIISQGRSDINMWLNIIQIVIEIGLIFLTYQQGMISVVIAYTLLNIFWLLTWMFYARRLIGIRFFETLADICPFMLISLAVMAVTYLVTLSLHQIYLLLFVRIAVAAFLYIGVMKVLRVKIMEECVQFFLAKFKK